MKTSLITLIVLCIIVLVAFLRRPPRSSVETRPDRRPTLSHTTPMHTTLGDWIRREGIPFSTDSPASFSTAVDKAIASLGDSVELLGFGEALHGGEDILILRNRLFQRLVEAHGYSAIAIESSLHGERVVDDDVEGRGPAWST